MLLADSPAAADSPALKLCDLGACADLRTGTNWVPDETIIDPGYAAPEKYIMGTKTWDKQHLVGGLVWAANAPDRFDSFSAGLVLMQMAVKRLRPRGKFREFRRQLEACEYDLDAWREAHVKSARQERELWMLDADDGAGWKLASALLIYRSVESSAAALAGKQRPSASEALARYAFLAAPPGVRAPSAATAQVARERAPAAKQAPKERKLAAKPEPEPKPEPRLTPTPTPTPKPTRRPPAASAPKQRPSAASSRQQRKPDARAPPPRQASRPSATSADAAAAAAAAAAAESTTRMTALDGATADAAQLAGDLLQVRGALSAGVSGAAKLAAEQAAQAAKSLSELVSELPEITVTRGDRRADAPSERGPSPARRSARAQSQQIAPAAGERQGAAVRSERPAVATDPAEILESVNARAVARASAVERVRKSTARAADSDGGASGSSRAQPDAAATDVYSRLRQMEESMDRIERLASGSTEMSAVAGVGTATTSSAKESALEAVEKRARAIAEAEVRAAAEAEVRAREEARLAAEEAARVAEAEARAAAEAEARIREEARLAAEAEARAAAEAEARAQEEARLAAEAEARAAAEAQAALEAHYVFGEREDSFGFADEDETSTDEDDSGEDEPPPLSCQWPPIASLPHDECMTDDCVPVLDAPVEADGSETALPKAAVAVLPDDAQAAAPDGAEDV